MGLNIPSVSLVKEGRSEWLVGSATVDMDLDNALNELGMLSSITESRRQFMRERQRKVERMRTLSVPETSPVGKTPANSPVRNGCTSPGAAYRIVQINPQFIVNLSTDLVFNPITPTECQQSLSDSLSSSKLFDPDEPSTSGITPLLSRPKPHDNLPTAEEIENTAANHRLSKVRSMRNKRHRKPYDFPWKSNLEYKYCNKKEAGEQQDNYLSLNLKNTGNNQINKKSERLKGPITPDKLCFSNASTPEKSSENCVYRSKSLDELDFAKLRLAEAENHNYVLQVREIDNMSQNLKDLHVNE